MSCGAVLRMAVAGMARRWVQTVVVFLVLTLAATVTMVALTLAATPTLAYQAVSARYHNADGRVGDLAVVGEQEHLAEDEAEQPR